MPFRQRVARRLGDAVSSYSTLDYPTPPSSECPLSDEEDEERKGLKQTSKRDTIGKSAQSGRGGITKAAAKRTKQSDKMLAKSNANKVTKPAGGVGDMAKRPYQRKTYHRVARVTRRSSTLTDQLSPDSKPYLSYHDVLLTHEDVKALKSEWLTDNNIAFWEEWLEREILPKYPQARIVLLKPSMTFLLMKNPNLKDVKEALPNLSKVSHIFLPINDNRDVQKAEGGSHWSLLLVSTIDGVAFHYDSLGGANYQEARHCASQLSRVLNIPLRFQALDDCPQQENGSDCGVFVCILMRHLLVKRLLNANAKEKVSMSMANKQVDSYGGRKEMLKIVESMRKEGERRRSVSPFASTSTPPRID